MMNDALSRGTGRWFRTINKYREELKLTWDELDTMDRTTLKRIIRKFDDKIWEQGLLDKQLLRFYAL